MLCECPCAGGRTRSDGRRSREVQRVPQSCCLKKERERHCHPTARAPMKRAVLPLEGSPGSIHRKAFSGSVNMGIIRNGADGIQRHNLVSAGGLPKHAQGLLDSRFRTLRFDHVASRIVNALVEFHGDFCISKIQRVFHLSAPHHLPFGFQK